MATIISHYLDSIKNNLRLDLYSEKEVISELETHIEDELQDLKETGLSEEEAAHTCVQLLGSAKLVARQIYEAHSQGSWRHVLLASMPHLLFGLLFALNWWHHIGWLSAVLIPILIMAVYGWWHGRPAWLSPWLGYSLLPVVVAGLFLLYLPKGWSWLAILLYIPLAVWLLYCITVQTIKRDWLYSSLMLFPMPIIAGWCIAVGQESRFPEFSVPGMYELAPWIGLSFLAMGATAATFMRLRQRWLKTVVVFISGLLILVMVGYFAGDRLGLPNFFVLILTMSMLFLIPALLERRLRRSKIVNSQENL